MLEVEDLCDYQHDETIENDTKRNDDPQTLALENALVLKTLFSFCNVDDLKQIRQVSRLWNVNSFSELRQQSWTTVYTDFGHWNDISKYIRRAQLTSPTRHVKNYRFKYMNLTDENNSATRVIELMERFGKYFVKLHLKRCCLDRNGQFWNNLIQKSKWTPYLQELLLEECCFMKVISSLNPRSVLPSENRIQRLTFHSDRSEFNLPCDLYDFWKVFPKLETLILMDLSDDENQKLLESTTPAKLKTSNAKLHITEIDIFSEKEYSVRELPLVQLRLFSSMKVNLTSLTIDIGENISETEFEHMLLAYAHGLQKLIIWRGLLANKLAEPGFPFGIKFPVLRSLEVPESAVCNFNFIHKCPQLLYLNLRQCDLNPIPYETDIFNCRYSYADMSAFVKTPHHVLKELKVEFIVQNRDLEFLRGIFPRLRIFSAFINRKFVQENF